MRGFVIAAVAALVLTASADARDRKVRSAAAAAPDSAALRAEAERFMAAYARDLLAGDRAAIAARYDRRGAWHVGNGRKAFEAWTAIRDFYAGPSWSPPESFAWSDLEYEPLGPDSVAVVGLFRWGAAGRAPVTVSYVGLLVRQDGGLRIRLEDESRPVGGAAGSN